MVFENLNSLETLKIQNNKLVRIPEEVMEPVIDTLRAVDIMGEYSLNFLPDLCWLNTTICRQSLALLVRTDLVPKFAAVPEGARRGDQPEKTPHVHDA